MLDLAEALDCPLYGCKNWLVAEWLLDGVQSLRFRGTGFWRHVAEIRTSIGIRILLSRKFFRRFRSLRSGRCMSRMRQLGRVPVLLGHSSPCHKLWRRSRIICTNGLPSTYRERLRIAFARHSCLSVVHRRSPMWVRAWANDDSVRRHDDARAIRKLIALMDPGVLLTGLRVSWRALRDIQWG